MANLHWEVPEVPFDGRLNVDKFIFHQDGVRLILPSSHAALASRGGSWLYYSCGAGELVSPENGENRILA